MLCLLFSCYSIFSQDPNFHIYLCFGQSNMKGNAAVEAQDKTNVDSRFKLMAGIDCPGLKRTMGSWYTAVPPLCRCSSGLTPVDYFGRTLVDSLPENITVGVINVAVGGCKIELFDKVNYAAYIESTNGDWLKNDVKDYGGNPYERLVELGKLAQKDGVIKGILVHQGESNKGEKTWPQKLKGVYDNLISDLGLNPTQTPLLVGEVVHSSVNGKCGIHNEIIAAIPSVIPNSYIISSAQLQPASDSLHFTAASYRILGKRYAEKMLSILKPNTARRYVTNKIVKVNPFHADGFVIRLDGKFTYQITDIKGSVMESGTGMNMLKTGKSLSRGVYLISVTNKNGKFSQKILKSI
ncbi:MAG: sialate O-acetylesterase [Fibrobacter sp.]|nr:sialate O-acetylesterase [Fibrobacter sp.]